MKRKWQSKPEPAAALLSLSAAKQEVPKLHQEWKIRLGEMALLGVLEVVEKPFWVSLPLF